MPPKKFLLKKFLQKIFKKNSPKIPKDFQTISQKIPKILKISNSLHRTQRPKALALSGFFLCLSLISVSGFRGQLKMSRPEYPRSIPNFWPHYRPTFKKRFWLSKGLSNRDKLLKPTLRPQLILVNSCKPCQVKFPAIILNFRLSLLPCTLLCTRYQSCF